MTNGNAELINFGILIAPEIIQFFKDRHRERQTAKWTEEFRVVNNREPTAEELQEAGMISVTDQEVATALAAAFQSSIDKDDNWLAQHPE